MPPHMEIICGLDSNSDLHSVVQFMIHTHLLGQEALAHNHRASRGPRQADLSKAYQTHSLRFLYAPLLCSHCAKEKEIWQKVTPITGCGGTVI